MYLMYHLPKDTVYVKKNDSKSNIDILKHCMGSIYNKSYHSFLLLHCQSMKNIVAIPRSKPTTADPVIVNVTAWTVRQYRNR